MLRTMQHVRVGAKQNVPPPHGTAPGGALGAPSGFEGTVPEPGELLPEPDEPPEPGELMEPDELPPTSLALLSPASPAVPLNVPPPQAAPKATTTETTKSARALFIETLRRA
jgi:hypothetical protein